MKATQKMIELQLEQMYFELYNGADEAVPNGYHIPKNGLFMSRRTKEEQLAFIDGIEVKTQFMKKLIKELPDDYGVRKE